MTCFNLFLKGIDQLSNDELVFYTSKFTSYLFWRSVIVSSPIMTPTTTCLCCICMCTFIVYTYIDMCAQDIYILEAMVMVTTMGQATSNGGTRCQFYVNCSIFYVDGLTRMLDALCIDTHMSMTTGRV